ncbi:MAG TPA: prephenate dehydratase domain-containing protein [Gemmatimonadaceae bacterium]|nr:prephenate dehydratase domain-containing protein [Gemmatimonadaceae bacterium]
MSALSIEPAYPRVAFQGEPGAFGEAAVMRHWSGRAEAVPGRTFADALALVCAGHADYAVIPTWNSAIGELLVPRLALALYAARTRALDEVHVPVRQCLLALPGATLDDIRVAGSHPAALAQCTRFFAARPRIAPREAFDTAGAARELALLATSIDRACVATGAIPWYDAVTREAHELAVVASAPAAERYGLALLVEGIQDDPANTTRFVVVRARESRW